MEFLIFFAALLIGGGFFYATSRDTSNGESQINGTGADAGEGVRLSTGQGEAQTSVGTGAHLVANSSALNNLVEDNMHQMDQEVNRQFQAQQERDMQEQFQQMEENQAQLDQLARDIEQGQHEEVGFPDHQAEAHGHMSTGAPGDDVYLPPNIYDEPGIDQVADQDYHHLEESPLERMEHEWNEPEPMEMMDDGFDDGFDSMDHGFDDGFNHDY